MTFRAERFHWGSDSELNWGPKKTTDGYARRAAYFKADIDARITRIERMVVDLNTQHIGAGSPQGGQFAPGHGSVSSTSKEKPATTSSTSGGDIEATVKANVAKWSKEALARGVKPLEGSQGHPGLIATRRITAAKTTKAAGYQEKFTQPTVEAMKTDPKNFERVMNLLKNSAFYPNFRAEDLKGSPSDIARAAVNHMKDNLRFLYSKAQNLEADKKWYDGARMIVDDQAARYKLNDMSVAGVYAALSPQKDWNMNVYLGDRVLSIYSEGQKAPWDPKMDVMANKIWKTDATKKLLANVKGKTLGELKSPEEKAVWIRTFDEAHSDRTYRIISSTGERGEVMKTKTGESGKAAWQTIPSIASAIEAIEANGDRDKISAAMGDKHKVRSFYNNILDPHSANGDVTSDTHHVGAALLRDLGGSTAPVIHNFGNALDKEKQAAASAEAERLTGKGTVFEATGSSKATGISGTYPLYGDATRELAKELNIEPRQLQSVVWTTKRTLFANASDQDHDAIEKAWQSYNKGEMTQKQTQEKVYSILTSSKEEKQAGGLIERLNAEGGFTYNTKSEKSPTEGFVVSPYKDRETILDTKTLKPMDFANFIVKNNDLLSKPKHYFGAWHNKDDGKVYLDVAIVAAKAAEAEKLSRQNKQLAYFDLGKKETVNVQA
jgi:hypothetical protein